METFNSRKDRHKTETKIKISFHTFFNLVGIVAILSILIKSEDSKYIFASAIILAPFIFSRYIHMNFFTVSTLFFTIIPLEISIFAIQFSQTYISNLWVNVLILIIFPVVTISMLLMYSRNDEFLKKAKVALEFLNFILVTRSLILVLLAYQRSDFQFLSAFFDINKNRELGFETKDMFNYLTSYSLFPFLVSNLGCKFVLEWILYRKGRKSAINK